MKIKHNIIREGNILSGKVINLFLDYGVKKGIIAQDKEGRQIWLTENKDELRGRQLFLSMVGLPDSLFSSYRSDIEAQGMLDFINSFSVSSEEIDLELSDEFLKNFHPTFYSVTTEKGVVN